MSGHPFLRFAAVGALHNAVNVATFALAVDRGVPYAIAAVLAAAVALGVSFALNRSWTFRRVASGRVGGQALRFAVTFLTAVAAGVVLLSAGVEIVGLEPIAAQIAAIAIVAPLSFLVTRGWVFRPPSADGRTTPLRRRRVGSP